MEKARPAWQVDWAAGGRLASLMLIYRIMIDDTVSNETRVPDPEKCRTRYVGLFLNFSDCLAENPEGCEFAVRFGLGVLCYHPDRRRFEKTGYVDAPAVPASHHHHRA